MQFFETIRQGILGLLLFTGNWVLPPDDNAALRIEKVQSQSKAIEIIITMEMNLNKKMEELIDAGIPLNFRFRALSDVKDTIVLLRTLQFDIASFSYSVKDSIPNVSGKIKKRSHPMILLAIRDFSVWKLRLSPDATICNAEAEILYSNVSQLNRHVDMSKIWGHQKLQVQFTVKR